MGKAKKPVSYKDTLSLRVRPPLPPYHMLRATKRPGDKELIPGGGVHVHGDHKP